MKDSFSYDANGAEVLGDIILEINEKNCHDNKDIWREFEEILAEHEIEELARRKLEDFEKWSNCSHE